MEQRRRRPKSGARMPPEIKDYVDIVVRKKHPACKEQRMLVTMVKRVFREEDIYVDVNQLAKYMEFQKFFPFQLFEWEKFCFALHCCTYKSDSGEPRFPDLLLLIGRGAGKNGYLSFEDFCLLTAVNNIKGYNIDVCATSEDQAKTSFDEIREDVLEPNEDYFKDYFRWTKLEIENLTTNSKMHFRTSRAESKDGLRTGKVDFDEYHQYTDYKNITTFITGLGKRPHPRVSYATTDGFVRDGPLDAMKAKAMAILKGERPDNGLLPFICRLDSEKEVENPLLWVKANPSLPYRAPLRTQMLKEWGDCQEDPQLFSAFMTKRMNVPVGNKDLEVTAWENVLATNLPLPDLKGGTAVAAVDYAKTNDFVAVGLLFKIGEVRYWLTHTFVCRQSADLKRIKAPLDEWGRMGLLTFIDEVEINPAVVTSWIAEKALDYNITDLAIDQFRYALLSYSLEKIGFYAKQPKKNIKLVRPSDQQLIEPVINSMFLNRQIIWGDNPLMRWYTGNTKKVTSAHSNFSYEKIEPKSRKTDGFMALVGAMTLEAGLVSKPEPAPMIGAFVF